MNPTTLSIGVIGSVAWDGPSHRFKGFLPEVHMGLGSLASTLDRICTECRSDSDRGRLTVRVLFGPDVPIDLVRSVYVPWGPSATLTCEAAIPLAHGLGGVAYFGANQPGRRTPGQIAANEWGLVDSVRARPLTVNPLGSGFGVETLKSDSVRPDDIERLVALYQESYSDYMIRFTPEALQGMIRDNIVVVIRNPEGVIVAVGQGEVAQIETTVGVWRFVEISETATDSKDRGNGLSAHIRIALIGAARGERTLIYAESRANWGAVIGSNRKAGLRVGGRLDAHARINSTSADVEQSLEFGNLFVMYLPVTSY